MANIRILIVDDEEHIRTALCRWFDLRGFDTDTAQDGFEAVEKCKVQDYDIVTMDLEMPGMTGIEATMMIKEFRPDIPFIVLTGYFEQGLDIPEGKVAKLLMKPISLRKLEEEVLRALGQDGAL